MNGKSKFVILGILILISLNSFSQDKTQELSFKVTVKGLETKISSENLELTSRFLKPASVPQTSDLSTWKVISESSESKNLGGINGQMTSVSWSANTGQVDCETWISDNKKLVAFRQTFTNKTKKSVKLNSFVPLVY